MIALTTRGLIVLGCGLVLFGACEQLIGLEDRKRAPDGGADNGTPGSPLCDQYCDDVLENCDGDGLDAYESKADCMAVCSFLPAGAAQPARTQANTVSCRAFYAADAASAEQDRMSCPAAAPGGGGPEASPRCGDNCEAYCGLLDAVCPKEKQADCVRKCRGLPDTGMFSAERDFEMSNDTIQCRLAHLTAAARYARAGETADRDLHCGHASLRAALGERPYCDVPDRSSPNCKDYCSLVEAACESHPVYTSAQNCEDTCEAAYDKGLTTDDAGFPESTSDTLACRRWHAYFALIDDPEEHCPHAGPHGDGHCGMPVCRAYCALLERGCEAAYDRAFPGAAGDDACVTQCMNVNGGETRDIGYNTNSESTRTNTLQCRVANLVDALNGANTCERALPSGTCSR